MNGKKVILITGGSRGLGNSLARHLSAEGHIVYATTRNYSGPEIPGIHFLSLDLASDPSCAAVVADILGRERKLDVIINNAGVTLSGPTLGFSVSDLENVMQANLVGPFRLLKQVFSSAAKPGLVVNITSLNGFMSFPNFGIYCASKFAMEALGFALRHELAPDTKIVNVAPGALRAGVEPGKIAHKTAREKIPFLNWLMPLTSPEDVAGEICKLVDARSVPARILVGRDAKIINLLLKLLPFSVFDRLVGYVWRKK